MFPLALIQGGFVVKKPILHIPKVHLPDVRGSVSRCKTLKLTDFYKINKPKYVFLKLTPDKSIRNYNSSILAKTISEMYRSLNQLIQRENKKLIIDCAVKCSFIIDLHKGKADFYFIVSDYYADLFREKISEVWSRVTVEKVAPLKEYSSDALRYQLVYKKEDGLSLKIEKSSNEPLNSVMNILDILKEDERMGIVYNFVPCCQRSWIKYYDSVISSVKKKMPVDKNKTDARFIVCTVITVMLNFLDSIMSEVKNFFGCKPQSKEDKENSQLSFLELAADILHNNIELSNATLSKRETSVLDAQIMVVSESNDKSRRLNNSTAVCQSFRIIDGDNSLVPKKIKSDRVWHMTDFKVYKVEPNRVSTAECQNFIELPGKTLLDSHTNIAHIDTLETQVAKELQTGTMCIGVNTYKGNKTQAYLSNDAEYKNLTLCLVGPTRAGKTCLLQNLSRDSVNSKECSLLFDFCGNCELSEEVTKVFPPEFVKVIDCSDFENMQGMAYNEADIKSDNWFTRYENIKSQGSQVITLVNSINAEDKDLSGRMDRYLEAASLVVFINPNSEDKKLNDVFDVLRNHEIRDRFIREVPDDFKEQLDDYIVSLRELDETKEIKNKEAGTSETVVVGTKGSYINGIVDRVNKLKRNAYTELMLKHDTTNNINLIEEIQKPQLICLKMPEHMFKTETEKDVFCVYWLTKVWLALQLRKSMYSSAEEFNKNTVKVNLFFDELYQVPKTQEFLRSKLSQIAKFKCKIIISCHHLKQISVIRQELKAANTSYMLLSGCNKDNYMELKDELKPFELDDLLDLPRYNSLNLIKYSDGYAKFITRLPPVIAMSTEKPEAQAELVTDSTIKEESTISSIKSTTK